MRTEQIPEGKNEDSHRGHQRDLKNVSLLATLGMAVRSSRESRQRSKALIWLMVSRFSPGLVGSIPVGVEGGEFHGAGTQE